MILMKLFLTAKAVLKIAYTPAPPHPPPSQILSKTFVNLIFSLVPSNRPLGLRVPRWHLRISELALVPPLNLGTCLGAIS